MAAALALATLAMSGGYAAVRLLPSSGDTEPVFTQSPSASRPRQGNDRAASRTTMSPWDAATPEATPPLKRIRPSTPSTRAPIIATPTVVRTQPSLNVRVEDAVARLTNQERARAGCRPLRIDSRLRVAARRHSADMAAHDYFSHTSLSGATFADRIKAAGYPTPGAENIAQGYRTSTDVMAGWMKSPGHRANILNCGLHAIGVGVHFGSGGPWWTQDFGWD